MSSSRGAQRRLVELLDLRREDTAIEVKDWLDAIPADGGRPSHWTLGSRLSERYGKRRAVKH